MDFFSRLAGWAHFRCSSVRVRCPAGALRLQGELAGGDRDVFFFGPREIKIHPCLNQDAIGQEETGMDLFRGPAIFPSTRMEISRREIKIHPCPKKIHPCLEPWLAPLGAMAPLWRHGAIGAIVAPLTTLISGSVVCVYYHTPCAGSDPVGGVNYNQWISGDVRLSPRASHCSCKRHQGGGIIGG